MMRAAATGVRAALASPALLVLLWLVLLLTALPAAVQMGLAIERGIGASRADESLLAGLDLGWLGEFSSRAGGIEATLTPSVVGAGPVLDSVEAWLRADLFTAVRLAVFGGLYLLGWVFLLGGVLDRFARAQARLVLGPFLAASARFFPRLLRLSVVSGALYFLIYRFGRWLFPWIERRLIDVTVERTALAAHLGGMLVVVGLLLAVNLVFDYAKIAVVFEGRRSALGALIRALRFVASNPASTAGVYGLLLLLGAAVAGLYAWLAPGPEQSSLFGILLALFAGQLYLVARLAVRLSFYAAQTDLYMRRRRGAVS